MSLQVCYCGRDLAFEKCCKPYHDGTLVPSAEALVRARFSAFCVKNYKYLLESTHPDFRHDLSAEDIAKNTDTILWQNLEIVACGHTSAQNDSPPFPTVTFRVLYEHDGSLYEMAETSYFQEYEGILYFVESVAYRPESYKRSTAKVGRNEPCPCGSHKKYKKCCALHEELS